MGLKLRLNGREFAHNKPGHLLIHAVANPDNEIKIVIGKPTAPGLSQGLPNMRQFPQHGMRFVPFGPAVYGRLSPTIRISEDSSKRKIGRA
jgi:hypothetical protein